jgi:phosphoglycerate dehydrogenase-like enzyme
MPLNVLITVKLPDELLDRIRTISPEVQLVYAPVKRPDELPPGSLAAAEVMYTMDVLPRPEEAPRLRWVQFQAAGIDHVVGQALFDTDTMITTASGIHAIQVAEYVMAMLLAWAHRLPSLFIHQQRGMWPSGRWERFVPRELNGATIGILGYGSIGREVARLARSFGMRVLATKRDVRRVADEGHRLSGIGDPSGELPDRIYPPSATASLVSECDYVVLCLPLTQETRHLIDEEMLRAFRPTGLLVNVGRGGLVDEGALIRALKRGWLGGAALDVFEVEPLPADSPLWKMDNVILSPHVAGFTPTYDQRAVDLFVRNIRRYLEHLPLLNLADPHIGY